MARKAIERPFNGGRWTRARYFGFIRTALRKASVRWPPRIEAKNRYRRQYRGENKRRKWEYQCSRCGEWFADGEVEIDHLEPCGKLQDYADLPEFVRKLFCEAERLQLLCHFCHQFVTQHKENDNA